MSTARERAKAIIERIWCDWHREDDDDFRDIGDAVLDAMLATDPPSIVLTDQPHDLLQAVHALVNRTIEVPNETYWAIQAEHLRAERAEADLAVAVEALREIGHGPMYVSAPTRARLALTRITEDHDGEQMRDLVGPSWREAWDSPEDSTITFGTGRVEREES